jgi:hypothetical protein
MTRFCIALVAIAAFAGAMPAADDRSPNPPAWIELARESNLPLHTEAIESELWATPDEARMNALEDAAARTARFAAEAAPQLRRQWSVPTWFVQDFMLKEPIYVEEIDWHYGPMYKAHALLDLTPEKRELVLSYWNSTLMQKRIGQIGCGLGFLLVCVATLLGYLRLDDVTRGYYSRWLATGALAVVIASAAALYQWVA